MQKEYNEEILLYLIYKLRKVSTALKLQKLMFLIFAEGKVPNYFFKSHLYGPYSQAIQISTAKLSSEDFIDVTKFVYTSTQKKCYVYEITDKGRSYVEAEITHILPQKIKNQIDSIIEKYADFNHDTLVEYVHKNYTDVESKTLDSVKIETENRLQRLLDIWNSLDKNNSVALNIAAYLEYCKKTLTKLNDSIKPMQKVLLLSSVRDLLNYIEKFTAISIDNLQAFSATPIEIEELFSFVEYICEKYSIIKALDSEELDYSDFISEEDAERLSQP